MNHYERRRLKTLYKEYSSNSRTNIEVRRKIKQYLYRQESEKNKAFLRNYQSHKSFLQNEIIETKRMIEIENAMKDILVKKDFYLSDYKMRELYNKLNELERQLMILESKYNFTSMSLNNL